MNGIEMRLGINEGGVKEMIKKCANCKYRKDNHCNYYDGTIVRNVNWFNKCKGFKEKE